MLLAMALTMTESNAFDSHKTIPQDEFSNDHGSKLPELEYYKHYEELRASENTVVVYPIFTQSAYEWGGFHDFYLGRCDSCLSIEIHDFYFKSLASGGNGFRILEFLGYDIIDDIDLDKNPKILEKYDKVILLHNEFVTENEFNAIMEHPKVIYLYPNALSSKIESDYSKKTITLLRGPGYPTSEITNGFDWKNDNSEYFNDWDCNDWKFYEVENGHMLNCYPENYLPLYGLDILRSIKLL